jgi:large repetitive protein
MRRIRIAVVLVLAVVAASLLAAGARAFGIVQEPLPTAYVGAAYSYQVKVNGGNPPYTFKVISGGLPPGISLSSSGLMSGTPTQTGSWNFYIQASYVFGSNPPAYSERQFTLNVGQGLVINTASLPNATIGTAYSQTLTASGGGTQTWSITAGALPGGLALASNGVLSGTPTTVGTFSFTVKVADGARSATKGFTIVAIEALKVTAPTPTAAVVGSDFTWQLQGTGGAAPYTWKIGEGTWPRGLSLQNGVISGRPRVAGAYAFSVVLVDSLANQISMPLTLVVQPRLKITAQTLRAGKVGRAYIAKIVTRGGAKPLFFEIDGGALPPGLKLSSRTGALTGKPRVAGRYGFVVRVTDDLGGTNTRRLTLRVVR